MADRRPADECPFSRPLPDGFDACPAFNPVSFVPLTSLFEPLRSVLTCRHMEVALHERPGRAYYCRCAIGDGAARQRMAEAVSEERRRLLRELAGGLIEIVQQNSESLAAVKGRELAAQSEAEARAARQEVRRAAEQLGREMRSAVTDRWLQHVRRLDLRVADLLAVIDAGVEDFERHGFSGWHPPEKLLAALPADLAAFLRPAPPAGAGTAAPAGWSP